MTRRVLCLCGLLLLAACSGGDSPFQEDDSTEINRIIAGATTAARDGDVAAFQVLEQVESGANWSRLQTFLVENGSYATSILNEPVQLERRVTSIHVSDLRLQAFYDFSSFDDRSDRAYQLEWHFQRQGSEDRWTLEKIKAGTTGTDYNNMISDLKRMPDPSFAALGMRGAPVDSLAELLAAVFRALRSENTDALHLLTVDGALFQAQQRGVAMPTLDNSQVLGEYNRNLARDAWGHQIRNLQNFSVPLNLTDEELLALFQTYVPAVFPQAGTALRLTVEFAGEGVAESVESFRLTWTAAFLHGIWLVDEMAIDRVEHY